MKCPACDRELTPIRVENMTVDACKGGCGGVWFDRFELQKVDEPDEAAGEVLVDIETDPSIRVDSERNRICPKCDGIVLMRHYYSVRKEIEVDECPGCAGIWIDRGELAAIRNQFDSEEDRHKAAEDYFNNTLQRPNGKDEGAAAG